jgi:hypothetical protein
MLLPRGLGARSRPRTSKELSLGTIAILRLAALARNDEGGLRSLGMTTGVLAPDTLFLALPRDTRSETCAATDDQRLSGGM